MIKDKNDNFTSVIYKGEQIAKIYHGIDLVFQRNFEIKPNLVGSFGNTSASNCWWYFNDVKTTLNKDFEEYIDVPITYGNRYQLGTGRYISIFSTYLTRLDKFPDTSHITDMHQMFDSCSGMTECNAIRTFNTKNVTDMKYMFYNCRAVQSLDCGSFNTEQVTDMSYMFYNCTKMTECNVSSFDTRNVTNFTDMFYGCSGLTSLDLSSFDVSNGGVSYKYNSMFYNCKSLETLNLSNWKFHSDDVPSSNSMLYGCNALKTIYMYNSNEESRNKIKNVILNDATIVWYDVTGEKRLSSESEFIEVEGHNVEIRKYEEERKDPINGETWWVKIDDYEIMNKEDLPTPYATIDLNDEWQNNTYSGTTLDGYAVYESFSNYNVNSGVAKMRIYIDGSKTDVAKFKYRSDAQSTYDYLIVGKLDAELPNNATYTHANVLYNTRGKQNQWYDAEYQITDNDTHFIEIIYLKNASTNTAPDKGFIAIPCYDVNK